MTFSIVAIDKEAKEIGIAVASKYFSVKPVGTLKTEIGAIASQARGNFTLGKIGIELLSEGKTPEEILEHFKEIDEDLEKRQLGIVSFKGESLTFTGESCFDWAGGKTGEGYSCQGNILAGPEVVEAMAKAFEQTTGQLSNRLLAALEAGNAAGGDTRGRQSAFLMVKSKEKGPQGLSDDLCEFHVNDHERPIVEIRRYHDVHLLYQLLRDIWSMEEEEQLTRIAELKDYLGDNLASWTDEGWVALASLQFKKGSEEEARQSLVKCLKANPVMRNSLGIYLTFGTFTKEMIESL
ncbi:MAG: DUF1028 domain-containing protein [Candidatus Kariarchaeaceae archaeon]